MSSTGAVVNAVRIRERTLVVSEVAHSDRSGVTAKGSWEERREGMLLPFRIQLEFYTEAFHSPYSYYVNRSPGTTPVRNFELSARERFQERTCKKAAVECRRESEERALF